MNKRKLPFNIRKSGSKYLFHGRIPTDLLNHPFFGDHKGFYSKSLGTDNLREATRRRDEILTTFDTLREGGQEEKFDLWTKKYREETEQFIKKHPHFEDPNEFKHIELELLLEKLKKEHGIDVKTGDPKVIPEDAQVRIDALVGKSKPYKGSMRFTLKKIIREREARKGARGSSYKTLNKIQRSVTWYLEQVSERDVKLDAVKWEDVQELVTNQLSAGVPGKTISGYMYGLRQVWKRAYQNNPSKSHLNPFSNHNIPTNSSQSYDPYTWDEVRALWLKAENPELKLAIQVGATTGARIGEVATLTTQYVDGFDSLCYAIKTKEKGKTEHASRILPVHPKLAELLGDGWSYPKSNRALSRDFSKLKEEVISDKINLITGKERLLGFHSFRSSVSTYLINNMKCNEATASTYTGHKPSGKSSAIIGYVDRHDLEIKMEMCQSLPWVFG